MYGSSSAQKSNPVAIAYDHENYMLSIQETRWLLKSIGAWPKSLESFSMINRYAHILMICNMRRSDRLPLRPVHFLRRARSRKHVRDLEVHWSAELLLDGFDKVQLVDSSRERHPHVHQTHQKRLDKYAAS